MRGSWSESRSEVGLVASCTLAANSLKAPGALRSRGGREHAIAASRGTATGTSLRSSSLATLAPVVLAARDVPARRFAPARAATRWLPFTSFTGASSGFPERPGPFHSHPTATGAYLSLPSRLRSSPRSLRSLGCGAHPSHARFSRARRAEGARRRDLSEASEEARSEARPVERPGAFRAVSAVELQSERPGGFQGGIRGWVAVRAPRGFQGSANVTGPALLPHGLLDDLDLLVGQPVQLVDDLVDQLVGLLDLFF